MQSSRSPRRKWILTAMLIVAALLVVFLVAASQTGKAPRVTATFSTFTNSAAGRFALFTFVNESPHIVHLYGFQVSAQATPCQAETIEPGQSVSYPVQIPAAVKTNQSTTIQFLLRRRDTW